MQTVWNDSGCKECRNAKIVDNSLSNCRRIGHQKQVSSIYQSEQPEVEYQAVQSQLLIKKSEYHALSSSQPFIRLAPLVTFVLSSPLHSLSTPFLDGTGKPLLQVFHCLQSFVLWNATA